MIWPATDITQPIPPSATRNVVIWLNVLIAVFFLFFVGYQLCTSRSKSRSSGKSWIGEEKA